MTLTARRECYKIQLLSAAYTLMHVIRPLLAAKNEWVGRVRGKGGTLICTCEPSNHVTEFMWESDLIFFSHIANLTTVKIQQHFSLWVCYPSCPSMNQSIKCASKRDISAVLTMPNQCCFLGVNLGGFNVVAFLQCCRCIASCQRVGATVCECATSACDVVPWSGVCYQRWYVHHYCNARCA